MVEVSICWGGQFQSAEADVIKSLVVNAEGLIGVLNQLMNRQSGIVWFNHSVRHLGRGDHRVGVHDAIRILLPNLGDEKRAHSRSSSSSQRVSQLKSLEAVTGLRFLSDNIEDRVNKLST